jgi:hypothetical protein
MRIWIGRPRELWMTCAMICGIGRQTILMDMVLVHCPADEKTVESASASVEAAPMVQQ